MKTLFILLLSCSFAGNVLAKDKKPLKKLDTETTEHGYDQSDFCGTGAKARIEKLNMITVSEMGKIQAKQKELNDLIAKKNIIQSFLDLRNDYTSSFQKIKNNYSSKEIENVDEFKRLLKSSLTFEALKATAELKSQTPTNKIEDVCSALIQENKSNKFCNYMTSKKIKIFYGNEIEGINKTLEQYAAAKDKLNAQDKISINDDFKAIYASIPQTINPEVTLGTLIDKAPDLVSAMGSSREKIKECLDNKLSSCRELMTSDKDVTKKILVNQLDNIHKSFASNEFDRIVKQHDALPEERRAEMRKLADEKLSEAFNMMKKQNASLNGIGFGEDAIKNFSDTCSGEDDNSRKNCEALTKELIAYFEDQKEKINSEIAAKTAELEKASNLSSQIVKNEKMKKYVSEKYMRKCPQAEEKDLKPELSPCLTNESQADPVKNPEITALNQKLSNVISQLLKGNKISKQQGELGLFSKDELQDYSSYCTNADMSNYGDICRDIGQSYNAIKDKKELKDWEKFNDQYWVVVNDKNAKGYDVIEKKSNARIFGEGLSMSIGTIYPMWLSNLTMGYQIETLKNQALYIKQINYMNDPNSPWMMNSYFQGNYFAIPNYTNLTGPIPSSTGFNFTN